MVFTLHVSYKDEKKKKASRPSCWTGVAYLLDIDLNVLLQVVAIQVEHEVMHKIKAVADNDQRQLVS